MGWRRVARPRISWGSPLDFWDRQELPAGQETTALSEAAEAPVRFGFDPYEWQDYPLAAILRAYREAYGLEMAEIADHLPHPCALPRHARRRPLRRTACARPYAIGFVRSYAKYLGLPVEDMVQRFREEIDDLQAPVIPTQQASAARVRPRNDSSLSRFVLVLLGLIGLMSSWTLWTVVSSNERNIATAILGSNDAALEDTFLYGVSPTDPEARRVLETEGRELPVQPEAPAATDGQEVVVASNDALDDVESRLHAPIGDSVLGVPIPKRRDLAMAPAAEETAPIDRSLRYRLVAVDLVWVQVRDFRENIIVSQMLQRGEELSVDHQDGLRLFTVSPRNLQIFVGDEIAEPKVPTRNEPVIWPLNREYLLPFSEPMQDASAAL